MPTFSRGMITVSVGLCLASSLVAQSTLAQEPNRANFSNDFDFLWATVHEQYAYFDKRTTDWAKVKATYRPQLTGVKTREEFIALLENMLEELYDSHCTLATNTASSPRLVPSGTDLWAQWRNGRAIITEVRPGSNAQRAGLKAGMEILSINGIKVERAVNGRIGKCLRKADLAAKNWALRVLLAGRHNEPRRLEVRSKDGVRAIAIQDPEPPKGERDKAVPLLEQKCLSQRPAVGYIRLHNSLGAMELIPAFDAALARLKNTRGLILDLRDTPSGGNTTVARAIMGRFIDREQFYQRHSIPGEERQTGIKRSWVEIVSPRPVRYPGSVVVLVDHWTGSMGEGIAIGMDAMKAAKIVGTEMAGLMGATYSVTLPHSRIGVNFPAEKLFHVNGAPREDFVPPVYVDLLSQTSKATRDPILEQGLKTLIRVMKERRKKDAVPKRDKEIRERKRSLDSE